MRDRRFATTLALAALATALFAGEASAQPAMGDATPLAVDLTKVPLGTWAEYQITMSERQAKTRWALVGRTPQQVTIETSMEGGPLSQKDGKMVVRLVMAPNPTRAAQPVKQIVMQLEGKQPIEMPREAPAHKFRRPDPKTLVGKETVKVIAGSFTADHHRDVTPGGTVDMWISEEIHPLGVVKMTVTQDPGGKTITSMELSGRGKDAKAAITKTPKPFNPKTALEPAADDDQDDKPAKPKK